MDFEATLGTVTARYTSDGPVQKFTIQTTGMTAEQIGLLSTWVGKSISVQIVPGTEQLELFNSRIPVGSNDEPESHDDGSPPSDEPPSGGSGYMPPGWNPSDT